MPSGGNGRRSSADSLMRDLDDMVPSSRSSTYQPSYQPTYDHTHNTTYDPVYNSRRTQHLPSPTYPTYASRNSSSGRTTGNRTSTSITPASYSSSPFYPSNHTSGNQYANNQSASPSGYPCFNSKMNSSSRTATSYDFKQESCPYGYGSMPSSAHAGEKSRTHKAKKEKNGHGSYDASSSWKGGEEMRWEKRGVNGNGSGRSSRP